MRVLSLMSGRKRAVSSCFSTALLLLLGVADLLPISSQAAPSSPTTDRLMDAVLEKGDARPLVGLAAVRLHDGKVIYSYYGGARFLGGDGVLPVRHDTLFRVASVSKLLTTIGLMQLVEQGKVNLDADASDYLGFRLRNPAFPDTPITVRMLITHTSSLRDDKGYLIPPDQTIASVFDTSQPPGKTGYHYASDPKQGPGAWFEYSNLGYAVLGTIIERVSGERFDRYISTHVLDPLGIDGGFNVLELKHPERLATIYRQFPEGLRATMDLPHVGNWPKEAIDHYQVGTNGAVFSPQGGLRISLDGLTKLANFMIHRGTSDQVHILSPETIRVMEKPEWIFNGHNGTGTDDDHAPLVTYGLTIATLLSAAQHPAIPDAPYPGYEGGLRGHMGIAYGLRSGFWYDPDTGDALLFAATGFPSDEGTLPGKYSGFSRVEELIFSALADADGKKPSSH